MSSRLSLAWKTTLKCISTAFRGKPPAQKPAAASLISLPPGPKAAAKLSSPEKIQDHPKESHKPPAAVQQQQQQQQQQQKLLSNTKRPVWRLEKLVRESHAARQLRDHLLAHVRDPDEVGDAAEQMVIMSLSKEGLAKPCAHRGRLQVTASARAIGEWRRRNPASAGDDSDSNYETWYHAYKNTRQPVPYLFKPSAMKAFVILNYCARRQNRFPDRVLSALAGVDLAWTAVAGVTRDKQNFPPSGSCVPDFWKGADLDCDAWRKEYMAPEPANMQLARRRLFRGVDDRDRDDYHHEETNSQVRNFVCYISALPKELAASAADCYYHYRQPEGYDGGDSFGSKKEQLYRDDRVRVKGNTGSRQGQQAQEKEKEEEKKKREEESSRSLEDTCTCTRTITDGATAAPDWAKAWMARTERLLREQTTKVRRQAHAIRKLEVALADVEVGVDSHRRDHEEDATSEYHLVISKKKNKNNKNKGQSRWGEELVGT